MLCFTFFLFINCTIPKFFPASKGWRSERIVDVLERGRIILVQDGDPPARQNKVLDG